MRLYRSVSVVAAPALATLLAGPALGGGLEGDQIHLAALYTWSGSTIAEADAVVGPGVELGFQATRYLDWERYRFTYDVDVSATSILITVNSCWQSLLEPAVGCVATHPGSGATMTVFPLEIDLVLSGLAFDGGPLGAVTVVQDGYVSTNPQLGGVVVESTADEVSVHFPLFQDAVGEYPLWAGTHVIELQVAGSSGATDNPFSVSVRKAGVHAGNGVVIADRWVLTSAVVGSSLGEGPGSVEAGTCLQGAGTVVGVDTVHFFNPSLPQFEDDLALLELSSPLPLSDPAIAAASIASPSSSYAGEVASMNGWWTTSCSPVLPMDCIEQAMPVIDNLEAALLFSGVPGVEILPQHLAVYDGSGFIGQVGGGTGIFVGGELVAISSFGLDALGCPLPSFPHVCTRLTQDFVDWIDCKLAPGSAACGAPGCSPCGCQVALSAYGGPADVTAGNPGFGLQIDNAPETLPGLPLTGLLLAGGPLSTAGTAFGCGTFYLPPNYFTWTSSTPPTGGGGCGWAQRYPIPLPVLPALAGLTFSAQGYALCPTGWGLAMTNGFQFTLE